MEFLVTGGNLSGYNTSVGSGSGGYTTTRTTTTTTRRLYDSSNPNGYEETTNTAVVRGINPYDQVDLIIQPDSSYSSSSKVLSTSVGIDQNHAPYFVLSLHDRSVREGDSILLEVIVSGKTFSSPRSSRLDFRLFLDLFQLNLHQKSFGIKMEI